MIRKLLFCLLLVFVACGEDVPTEGYVIQKVYDPAHWESGYRTESYNDCGMHLNVDGDMELGCRPATRQVYEAHHAYIPDRWKFRLENCQEEDGKHKCHRGWLRVDETTFHSYVVGGHYPDPH